MEPKHTNRLHVIYKQTLRMHQRNTFGASFFLVCRTRIAPTTRIFIFKEHESCESTECGLYLQARNASYRAQRAQIRKICGIRVRHNERPR